MKTTATKQNSIITIPTLFISIFLITGCGSAVQKKSPLISHVHIGHTLNGWVTTPNKIGLLATADYCS